MTLHTVRHLVARKGSREPLAGAQQRLGGAQEAAWWEAGGEASLRTLQHILILATENVPCSEQTRLQAPSPCAGWQSGLSPGLGLGVQEIPVLGRW